MIQVKNLFFSYNEKSVLKSISFKVNEGEFVGIIGPNGAGKSTLLKLLNRILQPDSGSIEINRRKIQSYSRRELARLIGSVPQDFWVAFNFNALEIVLMGRYPHKSMWQSDSMMDRKIALSAMETTDCREFEDRDFLTLSGGERQSVVLASALAQEPKILLLDEPTNALDLKHQVHFYRILEKLRKEKNMTILTVTHDINLASQYCGRILILKNGKLAADGAVKDVLKKEIVQSVYEIPLQIFEHPQSGLPLIMPDY
jgi:iron complex transport system ATP-binding protein